MKKIKNGVNKRIKKARDNKGLSQEALGRLVGVTTGYVSRLERGTRSPSMGLLIAIASKTDVSETWLITGKS